MKPTRTTNRIHFSDLDPLRFEDLCLNIIQRQREWNDLKHYGRKGNDNGIDILGINKDSKRYYFQCKRYFKIDLNDLKSIIDKISSSEKILPDYIELFISCDVSKKDQEGLLEYSGKKGLCISKIWTSSIIEAELYDSFHDLLFTYFGVNIPKERIDNSSRVKHSLRMKKRINKDFLRRDLDIDFITNHSIFEPHTKFTVGELIIRNINNDTYPEIDKDILKISNWFRVEIFDLYHNGIEVYLSSYKDLIYNEKGYWDLLENENDERKNKYKSTKVNTIGRIPFSNIVDYDLGGDEYYPMPHLYCKFNANDGPYESVEYFTYGSSKERKAPFHFEKGMRKEL